MSHNPPFSLDRTSAPVRVALENRDGLLRAALWGLLSHHDAVEVTDAGRAEVTLWAPGSDEPELEAGLASLAERAVPSVVLIADAAHLRPALAAGAAGVLLRDNVGANLVSTLLAVRGGLTVIDTALASSMFGKPSERGDRRMDPLTAREHQVIALLAEGLSNKLIAERLTISEHTAKFHVARIMAKLDAESRTEAVVRAARYGMLTL